MKTRPNADMYFKGVGLFQRTFLVKQTNDLCTCITKIVIIILNKAVFNKNEVCYINILCYK